MPGFWVPQDKKVQQRPPGGHVVGGHSVQEGTGTTAFIQPGEVKAKGEISLVSTATYGESVERHNGSVLQYDRRRRT